MNTMAAVGPGSRALLHYMSSLHNPRTARVTRGLLNFDMTIVYVDEGAAWSLSTKESASCVAAAAAAVAQYLPAFHFVTVPLEDVYTLPSALSAASDAEWLLEDRQHEGCIQQSQQPQQPSYLSRRLLDVGMAVDNGSSECSGSAPVQENGISSAAVNSPAVSSNNALRPGLLARERRSALQRLLKVWPPSGTYDSRGCCDHSQITTGCLQIVLSCSVAFNRSRYKPSLKRTAANRNNRW
jgi:hypothetical protein